MVGTGWIHRETTTEKGQIVMHGSEELQNLSNQEA
jgi:hypothetical protein